MVAGGAGGGGGFEVMVDVGRERKGVCDVDGFKSNDMWKCSEKVVCGGVELLGAKTDRIPYTAQVCVSFLGRYATTTVSRCFDGERS